MWPLQINAKQMGEEGRWSCLEAKAYTCLVPIQMYRNLLEIS